MILDSPMPFSHANPSLVSTNLMLFQRSMTSKEACRHAHMRVCQSACKPTKATCISNWQAQTSEEKQTPTAPTPPPRRRYSRDQHQRLFISSFRGIKSRASLVSVDFICSYAIDCESWHARQTRSLRSSESSQGERRRRISGGSFVERM